MESQIRTDERVDNKNRKFGSSLIYYPVIIIDDVGKKAPALFTIHQIEEAMARADANYEDIPEEKKNFIQKIFAELFG